MNRTLLCIALFISIFFTEHTFAQGWEWAAAGISPKEVSESWMVATDKYGHTYETNYIIVTPGYDSSSSTYGTFTVTDSGNLYQMVVTSTDSNGTFRWALGTQGQHAFPAAIATDTFGNVYVLGTEYGAGNMSLGGQTVTNFSVNKSLYFLAKINSAGTVIWVHPLCNNWLYGAFVTASGLATDPAGNVYVSGLFNVGSVTIGATTLSNADVSATTTDLFLAKFDSAGAPLWAKSIGGRKDDAVAGLATTLDGYIYVGGTFISDTLVIGHDTLSGTPAGADTSLFISKFDAAGNEIWSRSVKTPGVPTPIYSITSVATDVFGSVYFGGAYGPHFGMTFGPTTLPVNSSSKMYLAKYDAAGNARWAKTVGNHSDILVYGIAIDVCGNIWTCGDQVTSLTDPMFIFRFDTGGNAMDSLTLPSGGDDQVNIAVDNRGNFYVCADYLGAPFTVGSSTLALVDSEQEAFFVAKYHYPYTPCNYAALETQQQQAQHEDMELYPNPATDECTIMLPGVNASHIAELDICDITGKLVRHYTLRNEQITLPLGQLQQGVYYCRVQTGDGTYSQKLVIMR